MAAPANRGDERRDALHRYSSGAGAVVPCGLVVALDGPDRTGGAAIADFPAAPLGRASIGVSGGAAGWSSSASRAALGQWLANLTERDRIDADFFHAATPAREWDATAAYCPRLGTERLDSEGSYRRAEPWDERGCGGEGFAGERTVGAMAHRRCRTCRGLERRGAVVAAALGMWLVVFAETAARRRRDDGAGHGFVCGLSCGTRCGEECPAGGASAGSFAGLAGFISTVDPSAARLAAIARGHAVRRSTARTGSCTAA